MSTEFGLIHAILLDGKGGGKPLDWTGIEAWSPDHGVLWTHLDYKERCRDFLKHPAEPKNRRTPDDR